MSYVKQITIAELGLARWCWVGQDDEISKVKIKELHCSLNHYTAKWRWVSQDDEISKVEIKELHCDLNYYTKNWLPYLWKEVLHYTTCSGSLKKHKVLYITIIIIIIYYKKVLSKVSDKNKIETQCNYDNPSYHVWAAQTFTVLKT